MSKVERGDGIAGEEDFGATASGLDCNEGTQQYTAKQCVTVCTDAWAGGGAADSATSSGAVTSAFFWFHLVISTAIWQRRKVGNVRISTKAQGSQHEAAADETFLEIISSVAFFFSR